jgi:carboxyl-terminal processing protease
MSIVIKIRRTGFDIQLNRVAVATHGLPKASRQIVLASTLVLGMAPVLHPAHASESAVLQLHPTPEDARAGLWTSMLLTRHHYKPTKLDDAMSEKIFDRYVHALDGVSEYFTQTDIDNFVPGRTKLDDALSNENLKFPFLMFNRFAERVAERYCWR